MPRKLWIGLGLLGLGLAFGLTHIGAQRQALYATPSAASTAPMAFPQGFYWGAAIAAQQAESQQPTPATSTTSVPPAPRCASKKPGLTP